MLTGWNVNCGHRTHARGGLREASYDREVPGGHAPTLATASYTARETTEGSPSHDEPSALGRVAQGQATHCSADPPVTALNVPGGQAVQLSTPVRTSAVPYDPGPHTQASALGSNTARASVQLHVRASGEALERAGQGEHSDTSSPTVDLKYPTLHALHRGRPASS